MPVDGIIPSEPRRTLPQELPLGDPLSGQPGRPLQVDPRGQCPTFLSRYEGDILVINLVPGTCDMQVSKFVKNGTYMYWANMFSKPQLEFRNSECVWVIFLFTSFTFETLYIVVFFALGWFSSKTKLISFLQLLIFCWTLAQGGYFKHNFTFIRLYPTMFCAYDINFNHFHVRRRILLPMVSFRGNATTESIATDCPMIPLRYLGPRIVLDTIPGRCQM